jgi:hypothetical protein
MQQTKTQEHYLHCAVSYLKESRRDQLVHGFGPLKNDERKPPRLLVPSSEHFDSLDFTVLGEER